MISVRFRKWNDYRIVQCLNRCCRCCLNCFENCMKYVHHNAYTVISIQGVNFCPASRLVSINSKRMIKLSDLL
jgi:hypothetical protein